MIIGHNVAFIQNPQFCNMKSSFYIKKQVIILQNWKHNNKNCAYSFHIVPTDASPESFSFSLWHDALRDTGNPRTHQWIPFSRFPCFTKPRLCPSLMALCSPTPERSRPVKLSQRGPLTCRWSAHHRSMISSIWLIFTPLNPTSAVRGYLVLPIWFFFSFFLAHFCQIHNDTVKNRTYNLVWGYSRPKMTSFLEFFSQLCTFFSWNKDFSQFQRFLCAISQLHTEFRSLFALIICSFVWGETKTTVW